MKLHLSVSDDEDGHAVLEWWNGDRKVSIHCGSQHMLKIWGPNIDTEMEDVDLDDGSAVRAAFAWLESALSYRDCTPQPYDAEGTVYPGCEAGDGVVRKG